MKNMLKKFTLNKTENQEIQHQSKNLWKYLTKLTNKYDPKFEYTNAPLTTQQTETILRKLKEELNYWT